MAKRGLEERDEERFGAGALGGLRTAARELAWLLDRGYPSLPTLALVGDRHALDARARLALQRSVCGEALATARRAKRAALGEVAGAALEIDAFNLLVTLEVALCRGPVLLGSEGAYRDLAGLRGSYKLLDETERALALLGAVLRGRGVRACRWWVDAPVSNAGTLAGRLRAFHAELGVEGEATLVRDADPELAGRAYVASSDARVIDESSSWVDLAGAVLATIEPAPWVVTLSGR